MGLGESPVAILWLMVLVAWIWLVIVIFADICRDHELSGWAMPGP